MSLLLFKLGLPPLLVLLASLAGRRWGDLIGGWLVGLPLTSGPVAAFLAVEYGADFAALATDGSLVGAAAQPIFSLGYVRLAERGWGIALIGGIVVYAIAALVIRALPLPHWGFFILALAIIAASVRFIPYRDFLHGSVVAPWWDLPARMVVATFLVIALTAAGSLLGAQAAGVLATFPIFGCVLTVFAHRMRGAVMATQVLRGMVFALYGFATFFFVLGILLVKVTIVPAFVAATIGATLVQAGVLRFMRG